jgi:hypothetical protein
MEMYNCTERFTVKSPDGETLWLTYRLTLAGELRAIFSLDKRELSFTPDSRGVFENLHPTEETQLAKQEADKQAYLDLLYAWQPTDSDIADYNLLSVRGVS